MSGLTWRPYVRRPSDEDLDRSAELGWEESCWVRPPDEMCPDWRVFDAECEFVCRTDSRDKALVIARALDAWIHICMQADDCSCVAVMGHIDMAEVCVGRAHRRDCPKHGGAR